MRQNFTILHACHTVYMRRNFTILHACHIVCMRQNFTILHACHIVCMRQNFTILHACHIVYMRQNFIILHACHIVYTCVKTSQIRSLRHNTTMVTGSSCTYRILPTFIYKVCTLTYSITFFHHCIHNQPYLASLS